MFLSKLGLFMLAVGLFFVAPAYADSTSTITFSFNNFPVGPVGSDPVDRGSLSVVATGFSAPGMSTDLYENSNGLGTLSGANHEISGSSFVQLDLSSIVFANPSSVMLGIGGLQNSSTYDVWGSTNTLGQLGTLLASNQTNPTFNLSSFGQYFYIAVTSPTGGVLVDDVTVTLGSTTATTPEPGSGLSLLAGLAALAGIALAAKKL